MNEFEGRGHIRLNHLIPRLGRGVNHAAGSKAADKMHESIERTIERRIRDVLAIQQNAVVLALEAIDDEGTEVSGAAANEKPFHLTSSTEARMTSATLHACAKHPPGVYGSVAS